MRARKGRKVEDYETALNRYCSIVDKFESMDSTDIYLMGFGFECFKSAIFIQVIAHARLISHSVLTTLRLAYLCCQCDASLDVKLSLFWK